MHTRMNDKWLLRAPVRAVLVAGALALLSWGGAASAQTDTVTFPRGSLIIPMTASFQTSCGVVSSYGLIWRILQSNQPGHFNAAHPVTVYWIVNPGKTSPNRCVPSNKTTAPTPNSPGNTTTNHWDDPWWNDGCDMQIQNLTQMPVVPVNYSLAFPTSGVYPFASIALKSTSGMGALPAHVGVTVDNTGTGSARFNTVQYGGGPFVIDASDAANVINFLKNGDAFVPQSQLAPFITSCTCSPANAPSTWCHYVAMHQNTIQFTATVGKRMSIVPPKIALLDSGAGVEYCVWPANGTPPVGETCLESLGAGPRVLDQYLALANLDYKDDTGVTHNGTAGCPVGTRSNCALNGSTPGPGGAKYSGLIYDRFDSYQDLISTATDPYGLLNRSNAKGNPIYQVLWTPHWETWDVTDYDTGLPVAGPDITSADVATGVHYSNYVPNGDGAANERQNALNNVAYFLDRQGTGMMAQCASIPAYEGDPYVSPPDIAYSNKTQFMFNPGISSNDIGNATLPWPGRNCTDPMSTATGNCMLFPQPASLFAQLGDWKMVPSTGYNLSYGNRNAGAYKPGVVRLGVTWRNWVPGDYPAGVTKNAWNGWDIFSMTFKDNNPGKGSILYLTGHSYLDTTSGARVVMNTLMNLGFEPTGSDRSLTAPIAYDDPNGSDASGTKAISIVSTYTAIKNYPPGSDTFNPVTGSLWYFPLVPGNLSAHSIIGPNALAAGHNEFDAARLWDANTKLPLPHDRNVFTYFGGEVLTGAGLSPYLPPNASAPHGVRQAGWVPERVSGTAIASSTASQNSSCVDVLSYGTTPSNTFGLIRGSDGICDLQEATAYTTLDPASTLADRRTALDADLLNVQQMLQTVRGYCFATTLRSDGLGSPILEPTDSQCNRGTATNRAKLGGFVHSTPALVPPSSNVPDRGAPRPTVIYAGGYDGQIHAFYLSGGSGYQGPTNTLSYPNPDATSSRPGGGSVFITDWATRFQSGSLPASGTELWAFMPASQLPRLRSNNARVDSSAVVTDAFVDLVGSGVREWHTILVVSIGTQGREVLALDVTNPLKPVLLWDLVGSVYPITATYPSYSTVSLANSNIGGLGYAFKWLEPTALFRLPPDTDSGRVDVGLYNYSDLGGSSGLSIGQLRNGLEPVFSVFVASNASGLGTTSKAIELFSIDVATGQKLWQWEQPYTQSWVDNTVPPVASILTGTDGVRRVFVGDMEGRLWELDGATGQNINNATGMSSICAAPPCNYSAFDTQSTDVNPQPITTNIAVAKVPVNPTTGSALVNFPGATVLLFGTTGADWVGASVAGKLHVALLDDRYRVPFRYGGTHLDGTAWPQATAQSFATTHGVLQEAGSTFPVVLAAGEHLYGSVTVSGQTAFFGSAKGSVGDIMKLAANVQGTTYSLDLGAAPTGTPTTTLPGSNAIYGGMTLLHRSTGTGSTDYVVTSSVNGIEAAKKDNAGSTGSWSPDRNLSTQGQNGILYQLKSWLQRILD